MTVESRLAQVERNNHVLTGMVTILFLVVCSGLLVGWSQARPSVDPLRVRGLVIEDANGQARILMGSPIADANAGGNPRTRIIINDAAGVERFGLGLQGAGRMVMGFDAPPGKGDDISCSRAACRLMIPSPPLRFHVVGVDVLARRNVGHGLADVLAVLPDRVARLDVLERDLVADRDVVLRLQPEIGIVVRDDAEHVGSGLEAFHHDDSDRVLPIMYEELWNSHGVPPNDCCANSCIRQMIWVSIDQGRSNLDRERTRS